MEMALQKIVGIIAGKISYSFDMPCMSSHIDGVVRHNSFPVVSKLLF
jgi:hypothetical protein